MREKKRLAAQEKKKRAHETVVNRLDADPNDLNNVKVAERVSEQQCMGERSVSSDWARESVKDSNDPLYKTNLTLKEKIAEDFSLNSDYSDEEEDETSVPHVKRAPSSPVEASPSKVMKQSESTPPGQQEDEGG